MKNIFEQAVTDEVIARIDNLTSKTQPVWGKMNVAQMLAHCSVTYDYVYDPKHQNTKAKGLKKFLLKTLIKKVFVAKSRIQKMEEQPHNF